MFTHTLNQVLQAVPYAASLPFEQQWIRSRGPVRSCEWKDRDGTVCKELITDASVPEHLIKHGIENLHRSLRTTCQWVGCHRNLKPMKRESIVRHIREVHLRLRRPSKGAQYPYPFQHSVTSYHYHPIQTYSLPIQSVPPKETPHTCQWMREDGTTCGAQITYTIVSQHLITPRRDQEHGRNPSVVVQMVEMPTQRIQRQRYDEPQMHRMPRSRNTSGLQAFPLSQVRLGPRSKLVFWFLFWARTHKLVTRTGIGAQREPNDRGRAFHSWVGSSFASFSPDC